MTWIPELAVGAGTGLINMLGNNDQMSPEQRKVWQMLMGELGVAKNTQGQIDAATQQFTTQANRTNASEDASMARRGMPLSQGQTALAHADTNATFGKSLSEAIPQIQKNSKDEQMQIYSQLAGLAPQGQNENIAGDIGDLAGNSMYAWLMGKNKGQGANYEDIIKKRFMKYDPYGNPSPYDTR
jgi:hypothetical protein